jgi:hypothetical protein
MVLSIALLSRFGLAMRNMFARRFANGRKKIFHEIVRLSPGPPEHRQAAARLTTGSRQNTAGQVTEEKRTMDQCTLGADGTALKKITDMLEDPEP